MNSFFRKANDFGERNKNKIWVLVLINTGIVVISAILYVVFRELPSLQKESTIVSFGSSLAIGIALIAAILRYLDADPAEKYISKLNSLRSKTLEEENEMISRLKDKLIDSAKENSYNFERNKDYFLEYTKEYFGANYEKRIIEIVEKEYKIEIEKRVGINYLEGNFKNSTNRIEVEIRSLLRRGNLNLGIGIVTSLGALFVLLTSDSSKLITLNAVLLYYIPRISLVTFIEVFSFFFLRLYRNSLIDIKYYQNELTNIELKIVGVKISLLDNNGSLVKDSIDNLLKTERNTVLKSDENINTTLIANNESNKDRYYLDSIKGLIESVNKLIEKTNIK